MSNTFTTRILENSQAATLVLDRAEIRVVSGPDKGLMMNVGLSYPGISDMDTIGTPMKFSACVAENEERTPWDSWRVQKGFASKDSTVTVNVPYGMTEFFDFKNTDPELLVETLATGGLLAVVARAVP